VFEAMALTLWRDRAAFGLTFVLPPIIFMIFAAVFATAASGDLAIRLVAVAPAEDAVSAEIMAGLETSPLVSSFESTRDIAALTKAVQTGKADAGIEILRPDQTEAPRFRIYTDPVKSAAGLVAEAALAAQAPEPDPDEESTPAFEPAERISVSGTNHAIPMAAYYAAGVGMLFVFLSGFQSALSVIEERDAGVMARIAAGPYGIRPMVDGKFAFLTIQGLCQFAVLFLVAALVFDVSLTANPPQLFLTALSASVCAAGLSLAVVGACRTRSQAHAIGAVLALIMGALGGSMAPRFLMAPEVQAIGALTPNAWGIDAFAVSLWRGGDWALVASPWALLGSTGLAGLGLAYLLMARSVRD